MGDADATISNERSYRSVFAGWLWLPSLGMLLGPIFTLSSTGSARIAMAEAGAAPTLHMVVLATGILLTIAQIVAAVFYFRKRRFVPTMMVCLYSTGIAGGIILLAAMACASALRLTPGLVLQCVFSISWIGLWIGYFVRSKRVQATFIR